MMDISSPSFRRSAFYTALSLAIGACLVPSARAQDPVPKDRSLDVQWPNTELNRASALQQKLRSRNASPDSLQADALSSIRIPVLVPEKAVEMQNFAVRPVQGGNQYVVSAKAADGLKVSVVGSRIAAICRSSRRCPKATPRRLPTANTRLRVRRRASCSGSFATASLTRSRSNAAEEGTPVARPTGSSARLQTA